MKTFRKFGFAVMAVIACLCTASCSDGDNEPGSGKGSISASVDGKNLKLSHAYWWIDTESTTDVPGNKTMHIEFYSVDLTKPESYPGYVNCMTIDYEIAPDVNTIQPVTLQSGEYHIYLVQNLTPDDSGWQGETIFDDMSNTPCKIVRNGDNQYTIQIDRATVSDNNTTKTVTFKFAGPIAPLPESPVD